MRRSLYVKDDDFRLSFLHGNYITLSDLDEAAFGADRRAAAVAALRLRARHRSRRCAGSCSASPGTRPRSCRGWSGWPRPASGCTRRSCCARDLNDGAHLERTVRELAPLHPQSRPPPSCPWASRATASGCRTLRTLTVTTRRVALVDTVEPGGRRASCRTLGSRFVFLGDEVYLQAGRPLPGRRPTRGSRSPRTASASCAASRTVWRARTSPPRARNARRRVTVVSGALYAPRLARAAWQIAGPAASRRAWSRSPTSSSAAAWPSRAC